MTLLFAARIGTAAAEVEEPVCGPGIATIGDAWEYVTAERAELTRLLDSGDLTRWPQRLAALAAHLRFVEGKAYFLFGSEERQLERAVLSITDSRPRISELAFANQREELKDEWADINNALDVAVKQLPAEALIPTSKLVHVLPATTATTSLKLKEYPHLSPGKPARVIFTLEDSTSKPPTLLRPEDLVDLHGARLHAFVADLQLGDYQHLHPEPTDKPGEYAFTFTPKSGDRYRCWINLAPIKTRREEFPHMDLRQPQGYPVVPGRARIESLTAEVEGLIVSIHPSGNRVAAGALTPTHLSLIDLKTGGPVTDLEPYLGAFAHVVTFAEDFYTVSHIHPHGSVPRPDERGGPLIEFALRPPFPGFLKTFVQVQRGGRIITLPFGLNVEASR
ncbi:MAG TPA: hypothetical protein VD994_15675 [Prosthecobacter sp.]|nr:hypothetical protein [Prosthecobacter sp.]